MKELYERILAIRKIIESGDFAAYSAVPDADKNTCNAWNHVSTKEIEERLRYEEMQ